MLALSPGFRGRANSLPANPSRIQTSKPATNMNTATDDSMITELKALESELRSQVEKAEAELKALRNNHNRIVKLINLLDGLGNLMKNTHVTTVEDSPRPGYSKNGKKLGRPSNERLANLKAQNQNLRERYELSQKRDQLNKCIDSLDWIIDLQEEKGEY